MPLEAFILRICKIAVIGIVSLVGFQLASTYHADTQAFYGKILAA